MRVLRDLYDVSVFKPIRTSSIVGSNKVLVALFHRSAATLYLVYSIWGLLSVLDGLPVLSHTAGNVWQESFSAAIALVCIPACIGATFFPKTARLEMIAGSSFVSLIIIYIGFTFWSIITNGAPSIQGGILLLSLLVLPVARVMFVYRALIEAAGKAGHG